MMSRNPEAQWRCLELFLVRVPCALGSSLVLGTGRLEIRECRPQQPLTLLGQLEQKENRRNSGMCQDELGEIYPAQVKNKNS